MTEQKSRNALFDFRWTSRGYHAARQWFGDCRVGTNHCLRSDVCQYYTGSSDPTVATDRDTLRLTGLVADGCIQRFDSVDVRAAGDLDRGAEQNIVFQGDPADHAAWADVNVGTDTGRGFGKQDAETDRRRWIAVLKRQAIECKPEVVASFARDIDSNWEYDSRD